MSDSSKELVAELLLDNVSDDLIVYYCALAGILTEAGYQSHTDELEKLYSEYNALNVDILTIQTHVDTILLNALDNVLGMCGVTLTADLDIEYRVEIARAILTFDMSEEPEHLYRKLDNCVSDTEGLCKVLEYLTALPMDILYTAFEKVEPDIIDRIKAMIAAGITPGVADFRSAEEVTASDICAQRFEKLRLFKPDSLGGVIAQQADSADLSLETLYSANVIKLLKMPVEQAVQEIYSLSVLSSASFESVSVTIGECLDDLFVNIDDRAKAERMRPSLESDYKDIFGVGHEEV